MNVSSLRLRSPHQPGENLKRGVCLWLKSSCLLVWAGHVNVPHLHINLTKNSFTSPPSPSSWLCSTLTSTDRPNLLSFTANQEDICLVYKETLFLVSPAFQPQERIDDGGGVGDSNHPIRSENTAGFPQHRGHWGSFWSAAEEKPLKMTPFMLKASKRRDGQAAIVWSGLELRARHQ